MPGGFCDKDNENPRSAQKQAFLIAQDKIRSLKNVKEHCKKNGASFISDGGGKYISIIFLNEEFLISYPDVLVSRKNSDSAVPYVESVLLLHYFLDAKNVPLNNELVTFKEIEKTPIYYRTFRKRTLDILLKVFSSNPSNLVKCSLELGGTLNTYGDYSITINVLPRIPITIVYYEADDEFDAEGSILFDSSITEYLDTEDTVILSQLVVLKLISLQAALFSD